MSEKGMCECAAACSGVVKRLGGGGGVGRGFRWPGCGKLRKGFKVPQQKSRACKFKVDVDVTLTQPQADL